MTPKPFEGAKVAILSSGKVVVLRRDDFAHIPFPNCLDLPGGQREGDESPFQTVQRETREECGLEISGVPVLHSVCVQQPVPGLMPTWFFVVEMNDLQDHDLTLGDEGQCVWMMPVTDFLSAKDGVPHLQKRLADYVGSRR